MGRYSLGVRRLSVLVLGMVVAAPATGHAKPEYWQPSPTVDSEALAAGATAQLTGAIRARNAGGIAAVLGSSFTSNGMWFPDAACAKRFETGREIKAAEVTVFARCLARLEIQMSTRRSSLRDGAILTVAPGIEIEFAFKGDQVRWIGFPTQSGADGAVPMLTAQAAEALRTGGTTLLDARLASQLDVELALQHTSRASAWVKVCLDPAGAIARLTTLSGSSEGATGAFVHAIADWKFRPFEVRGRALPACFVSLLTYPAAKAPAVESYPTSTAPSGPVTRTSSTRTISPIGGLVGPPPPPPPPPPPSPARPSSSADLARALRVAGTNQIAPDRGPSARCSPPARPRSSRRSGCASTTAAA